MAFPDTTYTDGVTALTALENKVAAMGMTSAVLDQPAFIAAFLANFLAAPTVQNGLGYQAGKSVGGAVTQLTDRSTGVTLSKLTGQITTDDASLAAGAEAEFTVTNTLVAATDVIILNITPGGTGSPFAYVSTVAAGSFKIIVTNNHASTADTSADVINFAVIKGAAT